MRRGTGSWLIATALLVSAPLIYLSVRPAYFVDIFVQPDSEAQAQVLSRRILARADDNGVVFFDFRAVVESPLISRVFLEIRPAAEPNYYPQWKDGVPVVKRVASGVAQLGSPKWPLHQDEQYMFRLVDPNRAPLVEGAVTANAHAVSGASPWLLAAIGLVASVVQLLSVLWPGEESHTDR